MVSQPSEINAPGSIADMLDRGFFNRCEDLPDYLRVQDRSAVEWNHYPPAGFCVDPMATFGPQQNEACLQ
jgi:hypothetical protein